MHKTKYIYMDKNMIFFMINSRFVYINELNYDIIMNDNKIIKYIN